MEIKKLWSKKWVRNRKSRSEPVKIGSLVYARFLHLEKNPTGVSICHNDFLNVHNAYTTERRIHPMHDIFESLNMYLNKEYCYFRYQVRQNTRTTEVVCLIHSLILEKRRPQLKTWRNSQWVISWSPIQYRPPDKKRDIKTTSLAFRRN